jgi:hypothetical protein
MRVRERGRSAVATSRAALERDRETAMGWILMAIGAAAVAGAVAFLRRGGRVRRRLGATGSRQRSRAEQLDRPHRHVSHYHASGALPRWDP